MQTVKKKSVKFNSLLLLYAKCQMPFDAMDIEQKLLYLCESKGDTEPDIT